MLKRLGCLLTILLGWPIGAHALPNAPVVTEAAAQSLLNTYVRTWSRNDAIRPDTLAFFYDDQVLFYGKVMSRGAILREKLQYISVWTERHYWIVPGTVTVNCDSPSASCRVTGIMGWDRRSVSGARSIGQARLSVVVTGRSRGRIVRESAQIL